MKVFVLKHKVTGRIKRCETGLWKGKLYRWFIEQSAAQRYIDQNGLTEFSVTATTMANVNRSHK